MSETLIGPDGIEITVSDHIAARNRGEEVFSQMFINNISGGTIDASGNLTDLLVTGEVYNIKSGEKVNVVFNGERYEATISGRDFTCTIPAIDVSKADSGEHNITVESSVSAVLPLTITGAYDLSITASMVANTFARSLLVSDHVVGTYVVAAGYYYELDGETSSYFTLDNGDILLTAAGVTAYNNTSLALDHVNVRIKATDGTGRVLTKKLSSYISDPVELIEPTPTKPSFLTGQWDLTFQDEFTAPKVRDDHWALKRGTAGLGFNSIDSCYVENDNLVLMTQQDPKANDCEYQHFAGCEITTLDKFAQQYGYFECRAKGNSIRGSWPAFWLMPDNGARGRVPQDSKMLLSFDLSSVANEITSAVFTYTVHSVNQGDGDPTSDDLEVFTFREWDTATVGYDDIKVMPFYVLSRETVSAGSVVDVDVINELDALVDSKYHCMIADNNKRSDLYNIYSKNAANVEVRPVLTINDSIKIYPYQDCLLIAGNNGDSESRTIIDDAEYYELFDAYANFGTTSDGGMEVDIWENLGIWGADVNAHALHWDGYGSTHKGVNSGHIDMGTTDDGYHTYGVLWDEDGLQFYIDGSPSWYRSFTPNEESDDIRSFNVPAYILLSMQTGGWDGNNEKINSEELPAKAHFDYVRAWQKVEE